MKTYEIEVPLVGYAYVRVRAYNRNSAIDQAMEVATDPEAPEVLEHEVDAVWRVEPDNIPVMELDILVEEEEN